MTRRHFLTACGCCALSCPLFGWAQTAPAANIATPQLPSNWTPPARFDKTALDTDEGGLWAMMDREEARMRRSKFVEQDLQLNTYVRDMVAKIAGQHHEDIRVYIIRQPYFNATMAPNGAMQLWTGLLLRIENEAQLASVIAHEIAHYLERHSLKSFRDMKSKAAAAQLIGSLFAGAGLGVAGAVAQAGILSGVFAYSREQEREADVLGFELAVRAGYAPTEASKLWKNLIGEIKAETDWSGVQNKSVMFATHPASEEREQYLQALGEQYAGKKQVSLSKSDRLSYTQLIAPFRKKWLEDELRRLRLGESQALLERKIASQPDDPELRFFYAESFRLRNSENDFRRAQQELDKAAALRDPPPEVFRALGIMHHKNGNQAEANRAFSQYLVVKPDAADSEVIKSLIK